MAQTKRKRRKPDTEAAQKAALRQARQLLAIIEAADDHANIVTTVTWLRVRNRAGNLRSALDRLDATSKPKDKQP